MKTRTAKYLRHLVNSKKEEEAEKKVSQLTSLHLEVPKILDNIWNVFERAAKNKEYDVQIKLHWKNYEVREEDRERVLEAVRSCLLFQRIAVTKWIHSEQSIYSSLRAVWAEFDFSEDDDDDET